MNPAMPAAYQKTGYLHSDYRLFYLTTPPGHAIPYHYHDFHKLLILLGGSIDYGIEGRQYHLVPQDVVLVASGRIHAPVFTRDAPYERLIIYLSPAFGETYRDEGCDLLRCFSFTREHSLAGQELFRAAGQDAQELSILIKQLKNTVSPGAAEDSYSPLLQRAKLIELLIFLNRAGSRPDYSFTGEMSENPVIRSCIEYINSNLTLEELNVDQISDAVFLSRSYLMHLFKAEMGCTLGEFITEKRLFLANSMLGTGASITQACFQSGFRNYSAFYYAYRKKYHCSPASRGLRGHVAEE